MFAPKLKIAVVGLLLAVAGPAMLFKPAAAAPDRKPASATPEKSGKDLAALERKLCATWTEGGDCIGDIAFRADGTYEQTHFSPGNNTLAGTWEVRWDALPPRIVLVCKTSNERSYVGWRFEARLARLDDDVLVFQDEDGRPTRYLRGTREEAEKRTLAKFEGTWALVALERPDGTRLTGAQLAGVKPLIVRGAKWDNAQDGAVAAAPFVLQNYPGGTLRVYPEDSTADVDFVCTAGAAAGQTLPAIFAREGDTLKICVGLKNRPSGFRRDITVPYKDGQVLHVFERQKE